MPTIVSSFSVMVKLTAPPVGLVHARRWHCYTTLDSLRSNEPYVHESVVGTRFEGRIIETKQQDGVTLILPTITGSARITGKHTFVKDPRDSITSLSISSNDE